MLDGSCSSSWGTPLAGRRMAGSMTACRHSMTRPGVFGERGQVDRVPASPLAEGDWVAAGWDPVNAAHRAVAVLEPGRGRWPGPQSGASWGVKVPPVTGRAGRRRAPAVVLMSSDHGRVHPPAPIHPRRRRSRGATRRGSPPRCRRSTGADAGCGRPSGCRTRPAGHATDSRVRGLRNTCRLPNGGIPVRTGSGPRHL